MGVGFGNGVNLEYNNIVDELAEQGVTNSRAFSVALGPSSQNNGGLVIFGGIDTKKYAGKLFTFPNLPPQPGEKNHWRYWIQLDSIGFTKANGGGSTVYQNSRTPIVLDSGATYSYLPASIITKLAADFGGTMDSDGITQVPCSLLNQGGSVDFTFGQLVIRVPNKEFLRQVDSSTCIMGAMVAEDTLLLGDTFMRSAYGMLIPPAPGLSCGQLLTATQSSLTRPTRKSRWPRTPTAAPASRASRRARVPWATCRASAPAPPRAARRRTCGWPSPASPACSW